MISSASCSRSITSRMWSGLAVLKQSRQRIRARDHGDRVRLEHLEEIAGPGEQPLKPSEHGTHLDFWATVLRMPVRFAAALNSDGPNERIRSARSGSSTDDAASASAEPAPFALGPAPSRLELAAHRKRKHVDVEHQRRAVAHAFPVAIASRAESGRPARARPLPPRPRARRQCARSCPRGDCPWGSPSAGSRGEVTSSTRTGASIALPSVRYGRAAI